MNLLWNSNLFLLKWVYLGPWGHRCFPVLFSCYRCLDKLLLQSPNCSCCGARGWCLAWCQMLPGLKQLICVYGMRKQKSFGSTEKLFEKINWNNYLIGGERDYWWSSADSSASTGVLFPSKPASRIIRGRYVHGHIQPYMSSKWGLGLCPVGTPLSLDTDMQHNFIQHAHHHSLPMIERKSVKIRLQIQISNLCASDVAS